MEGNELFIEYASKVEVTNRTISDLQLSCVMHSGTVAEFLLEGAYEEECLHALKCLLHIGIEYFDNYKGSDFKTKSIERIKRDFSSLEELSTEEYLADLGSNIVDEEYSSSPLDRNYRSILYFKGFISICMYCGFDPIRFLLPEEKSVVKVKVDIDMKDADLLVKNDGDAIIMGMYDGYTFYNYKKETISLPVDDLILAFFQLGNLGYFDNDLDIVLSGTIKDEMEIEELEIVNIKERPFMMSKSWKRDLDCLFDHINSYNNDVD